MSLVGVIIGLVILFNVAAVMIPEGQAAGQTLNTSGVPFGAFFGNAGIVWIVVMASILIGVVYAVRLKSGK